MFKSSYKIASMFLLLFVFLFPQLLAYEKSLFDIAVDWLAYIGPIILLLIIIFFKTRKIEPVLQAEKVQVRERRGYQRHRERPPSKSVTYYLTVIGVIESSIFIITGSIIVFIIKPESGPIGAITGWILFFMFQTYIVCPIAFFMSLICFFTKGYDRKKSLIAMAANSIIILLFFVLIIATCFK